MNRTVFAVCDRIMAIWAPDLQATNRRFLGSMDPDWFTELARPQLLALESSEGEEKQRAAHAIRFIYYHALETFFSLLMATLQAPACLPAWLDRYRSDELRDLVGRVTAGKTIYNPFSIVSPNWEVVSEFVNRGAWGDETRINFAKAWRQFGAEFLDDRLRSEFNGAKHGFRTSPGGFQMRFGREETPGVPAAVMTDMGGSEFGSSILVTERIPGTAGSNSKPIHLRYVRRFVNWDPIATAEKIDLLAISIKNTLSTGKVIDGDDPSIAQYFRPADSSLFTSPFRGVFGPTRFELKVNVTQEAIVAEPGDELEKLMRKATGLEVDKE